MNPPSAGRRATFVALGVQYLVNALVYSTYVARLPDLRESTGLSLAELGGVLTLGNVAALLALPLCPPLIRLGGSRWVMFVAALIYVATLPAIGLATTPAALIVAVIVMMVSNTAVDVALAQQSAAFSAQAERPVMSRLAGIYSVGALLGAGLAALITQLGVNATTHLALISAVLILALLFTFRGLPRSDDEPTSNDESDDESGGNGSARVGWRSHPTLLLSILVLSAATVPLDVGPGEWATFRVREDLDFGSGAATGAYAAFVAGTCLGRFLGDHAAHRLGRTRLWYLSIGSSLAGIAIACLVPHIAAAYVGFAVAGLGAAVQAPLLTEAAARRGKATALSAFFIGNRLAGLATPLTIGALAGASAMSVGLAILAVTVPCVLVLGALGRVVLSKARK